jgi:hypothetical protein
MYRIQAAAADSVHWPDEMFTGSDLPIQKEAVLCPRCMSPRALSLTPAVRNWFCCSACGHIWPKQDPQQQMPRKNDLSG